MCYSDNETVSRDAAGVRKKQAGSDIREATAIPSFWLADGTEGSSRYAFPDGQPRLRDSGSRCSKIALLRRLPSRISAHFEHRLVDRLIRLAAWVTPVENSVARQANRTLRVA